MIHGYFFFIWPFFPYFVDDSQFPAARFKRRSIHPPNLTEGQGWTIIFLREWRGGGGGQLPQKILHGKTPHFYDLSTRIRNCLTI